MDCPSCGEPSLYIEEREIVSRPLKRVAEDGALVAGIGKSYGRAMTTKGVACKACGARWSPEGFREVTS